MLGIPLNREIGVKVICSFPDTYAALLNDFHIKGLEEDYKVIKEISSVQLIQVIGQMQLQPQIIHVIYYHKPKSENKITLEKS